jgi:sphingomyelin phosphodiesterase
MKTLATLFLILTLTFFSWNASAQTTEKEVASATEVKEEKDNLNILSWNIYMLPKIMVQRGKRERAYAIVEELKKSNFDIIVFQEAFLPKAREIIRNGLKGIYNYEFGPAISTPSILTNSGVWILSKVKMKPIDEVRFKDCATWDCYARKGAMLLEGEWQGKTFQLLGTHLQADNYTEVREKQMDQIYLELLGKYRRDDVPQIICGDLNTEKEMKSHYCQMLSCLDAEDGDFEGIEKATYDGVNNELAQSFGAKTKTTYDYILVRNNGNKVRSVNRFVSVMKKGKKHLSDHYGVVCELRF